MGPLHVPYVSQFQGQSPQSEDCGPTSVDMIMHYFGLAPGGTHPQQITAIRSAATGADKATATNSSPLEHALTSSQGPYVSIPNSGVTASQAMQEIQTAINNGQPVIILIAATKLGRTYHGHCLVVTGLSRDGKWVEVNDPDRDCVSGPLNLGVSLGEHAMAAAVNVDRKYTIAV